MQFLNTADVATRLAITADQVVALIRSGRLPAVNVGIGRKPRWRISEDALEAFLAAQSFRPPVAQTRKRKAKQPKVIEFFK